MLCIWPRNQQWWRGPGLQLEQTSNLLLERSNGVFWGALVRKNWAVASCIALERGKDCCCWFYFCSRDLGFCICLSKVQQDDWPPLHGDDLKLYLFLISPGWKVKSAAQLHFIRNTTHVPPTNAFCLGLNVGLVTWKLIKVKCSSTRGEYWCVCQFWACALKILITMPYLQGTQVWCTAV